MTVWQGQWRKMPVQLVDGMAHYTMRLGDERIAINDWVGQRLRLQYSGIIQCINCNRVTNKSFNQGYCFPCMRKLAECDSCMVRPETCHFDAGTCRDEDFANDQCFRSHIIYFSNTSGLKVGITRDHQIPTRWIDQGAVAAISVAVVQSRQQSGIAEVLLADDMADKTNWRKMLKNDVVSIDLDEKRRAAQPTLDQIRQNHANRFGEEWLSPVLNTDPTIIDYPVLTYPQKVTSYNLDKSPIIEDRLLGIKGQYLMFENGVINVRKYAGYEIKAEVLA